MSWLNSGSLAATNGNNAFVGTGTLMLGAYVGDALVYQSGTTFWAAEIASITDNTHFTTAAGEGNWPFATGTIANGTWSVLPCSPLRQSIATTNANLATIISQFSSVLSLSASDNSCTFNKAANTNNAGMYLTTGGAARGRIGTFGDDNLRLSVANGGGYTDALVVDYTTGLASLAGDPTAALGAATKQYVDGASNAKVVRAASTSNINVSSPGTTVGGVTPANGERYLLTGQTTASQNGIYVYNGSTAAMTRSSDASTATNLLPGCLVEAVEGTYAGMEFKLTTPAPLVIGTTNLTFTLQTEKPETTVASAATTDIGATNTEKVAISGTTTITNLGGRANALRVVRFTGSLTLTYNATSLITPTGADIVTSPGDVMVAESDSSGNWRVVAYCPVGGVVEATATNVTCSTTGTPTAICSVSLTPGRWRLSANALYNGAGGNDFCNIGISSTSGSITITAKGNARFATNSGNGTGGGAITAFDVAVSTTTTFYLNAAFHTTPDTLDGYLRAERIF